MKKFFVVLFAAVLMCGAGCEVNAQTTDSVMPVPYGNFELWQTYPGDTAVVFIPIPLYDSYILPDGWHAPIFRVNDTVDLFGSPLPLDISIPVALIGRDTTNVVQGRSGLMAETFQLDQVLTPAAYTIASQFLDSSLAHEPIPSIMTNAEVDLMKLLPLLEQAADEPGDLSWLLEMMDTVDLNDYMTGGFPLNGFEPKVLRGMYNYIDGNGPGVVDDNAMILAVGTYYDPLIGRRMLVGAGSKNLFEVSDTDYYKPFEMDYYTLNEYFPEEYAFVQADSMVLILISSANDKARAVGSKFFVDSLELVQRDGSCGRVTEVNVEFSMPTYARLSWSGTVVPDSWTVEYGPEGFLRGRGTRMSVTDTVVTLTYLTPGMAYDFYVRSECGDTSSSVWGYAHFVTEIVGVTEVSDDVVSVHPNPANGRVTLDLGGLQVSGATLYAITGQVLESRSVSGGSVVFDLPRRGVYMIELQTQQGNIYKKVVNN